MKTRDLISRLEKVGFVFKRHGSRHDIYVRGSEEEQIPRHRETNDKLAAAIIRKWGL